MASFVLRLDQRGEEPMLRPFGFWGLAAAALVLAPANASAQLFKLFLSQDQSAQSEPRKAPAPEALKQAQVQAKAQSGRSQPNRPLSHAEQVERHNQNTVTIISGTPAGTYLAVAYDMSAVLDDGDNLRVLAIAGKGSVQNVRDILRLKGVDMGIVQSDVMAHFRQKGDLGENIDHRLVYITKLYNEEMHLVVHARIKDVADLNGQKVSFDLNNSGTQFSSRLIFPLLGVKPEEVNMGLTDALVKIKSGEIAGAVFVVGRPAAAIAKLAADPDLKLLPVRYTQALEDNSYLPATLTHQDYPALIPDGKPVETIAVGAVLAVYNWPRETDRHRRVAKFVDSFFTKFPDFQKAPRHAKWKEVNLAATLKGWKRLPVAQEALDKVAAVSAPAPTVPTIVDATLARQQAAKAAPGDPAEQERLFQQFLEWRKQQKR
jgi:TRAP transporter TAXI family solute receptor